MNVTPTTLLPPGREGVKRIQQIPYSSIKLLFVPTVTSATPCKVHCPPLSICMPRCIHMLIQVLGFLSFSPSDIPHLFRTDFPLIGYYLLAHIFITTLIFKSIIPALYFFRLDLLMPFCGFHT